MTYVLIKRQISDKRQVLIPGAYRLVEQNKDTQILTLEWAGVRFTLTGDCLQSLLKQGDADLTTAL